MNAEKAYREKTRRKLHKNDTNKSEQDLESTAAVRLPISHL